MDYLQEVKNQKGIRGKLVLFYHDAEKLTAYQMVVESSKKAGFDLTLKRTEPAEQLEGSLVEHTIVIGNETIVSGMAENNKLAKELLGPKALEILQETCFTVVVKKDVVGENVSKWELENMNNNSAYNMNIDEQIHNYLEEYANSNITHKLIFQSDFNTVERKHIYESSNKLKLKAKGIGKGRNSQIVVSKKFGLWELVENLLMCGYDSDNYQLKLPTKIKPPADLNPQNLLVTIDNDTTQRVTDIQANNRKRPYEVSNVNYNQNNYDRSYEQSTVNYGTNNRMMNYEHSNYGTNSRSTSYALSNYDKTYPSGNYSLQCNIYNNYYEPPERNTYNDYNVSQHYDIQQKYNMVSKNKLNLSLSDLYLLNKVRQQGGCRGSLILFHNSIGNLTTYQMLVESAQKSALDLRLKRTGETKENLAEFVLEIGDEEILKEFAETNKLARDILGPKAWSLLQQNCFTVMVKTHLKGRTVDRSEIDCLDLNEESNDDYYNENKSMKMMRLMGWNGQGIGKNNDYRQKPVQVTENLRRFGLSFGKDNSLDTFQQKLMKYLEDYVKNSCTYNLVFYNEYSVDERKMIHETSLKLKLKSKSYGKEEGFQLVISKKLSPWELVEHLLANRDTNPNYQLIRPTNVMLYNYFYK